MNDSFPFNHFVNLENKKNSNNFNNLEKVDLSSSILSSEKYEINTDANSNEASMMDTDELRSITNELLQIIKNSINTSKYNAYFDSSFTVSSLTDEKIELSISTDFKRKIIENHYNEIINNTIFDLFGRSYKVSYQVLNKKVEKTPVSFESEKSQDTKNLSVKDMTFNLNNLTTSKEDIIDQVNSKVIQHMNNSFGQKIDPSKTFKNFIVGPSNNMAHAFAISVSKEPGKIYPQLYLHGNSGLGKTHLLHAICNHIKDHSPHLKVCVTTANAFMSEMIMAIQEKRDSHFRRKYTDLVDILIIDDIHELKNKTRTQTEFFHIFNELQSKGKQLIFTSDKAPKEIDGIEERIKTRLSSALLTEIQQPDLETRIAILKEKAVERDIYLDDDVVNLIASCVKSNIRELEGSLIKLGAYSDLMNVDIDLEIAKEQLDLVEDMEDRIYTIETIAKAVSSYYKIPIGDLRGKSRVKDITMARHIAMYMTHKILKITLEEIGEYYSRRDHTSVIHAINKIEKLVKSDGQLSQKIYEIESSL